MDILRCWKVQAVAEDILPAGLMPLCSHIAAATSTCKYWGAAMLIAEAFSAANFPAFVDDHWSEPVSLPLCT